MTMINLRNVFIVGAAKSGTTALYYLLSQHPQICGPVVKEPNYFSNIDNTSDPAKPGNGPGDGSTVWTKDLKEYHRLYSPGNTHKAKLDASVSYLYSTTAASKIAAYDSESTIIMVLRNPVDRAFSHYKHLLRDGRETLSFPQAIDHEQNRIQKNWEFSWHLTSMGRYHDQLCRYFDHFKQEQIRIFLFEDIINDIAAIIHEVTDLIGLEPHEYNFDQQERNASGVARIWVLSRLVNWILGYKATINKVISPKLTHRALQLFRSVNIRKDDLDIPDGLRDRLYLSFETDIAKTEQLIGRNLNAWRPPRHE